MLLIFTRSSLLALALALTYLCIIISTFWERIESHWKSTLACHLVARLAVDLPFPWATAPRIQALATLQAGEAAPVIKLLLMFDSNQERLLMPGLIVCSDKFCHEDRVLTPEEKDTYHTCTLNTALVKQHLAQSGATGVMARQLTVAWWKFP